MTLSWRPACPGIGEAIVCVLLFSGLCSCLHEYHFIDEPEAWHHAKGYCKEKYTALATINNLKDMGRLKAAVGSGFEGKVWIGLNDGRSKWKWSRYDPMAKVEVNFTSWHSGQPNDTQPNGKLCVAFQQGTWYDFGCGSTFPFVCYDGDVSNSSLGYVMIDQEMTWKQAQTYCRANHQDLAAVRSDHDNSEIQQLVGDDRFVWIGLFRHVWSLWAGVDSGFQNWVIGHPKNLSESCATSVFDADHAGEWVETHCHEKHPFVCHNSKSFLFISEPFCIHLNLLTVIQGKLLIT
ncbi:lymphocyte antigen 75-like, partial [Notolabrus celidotus]|uniref:lymphocyte antigen 75-like n=1 Tax=Notolabrus celidotus TaxID=1203425 RepID=UPI00148FDA41